MIKIILLGLLVVIVPGALGVFVGPSAYAFASLHPERIHALIALEALSHATGEPEEEMPGFMTRAFLPG